MARSLRTQGRWVALIAVAAIPCAPISGCATGGSSQKGGPEIQHETSSSSPRTNPENSGTDDSPMTDQTTGESVAFHRTTREDATQRHTLPEDFWLERTWFTARWPTEVRSMVVEVVDDHPVFLLTLANLETQAVHGLRVALGEPRRSVAAPPEPVSTSLRAISPDGKFLAYVEAGPPVRMVVADLAARTETVVLEVPQGEGWSIGAVTWAPTSRAVYFDNLGGEACIWRYDLDTERLEKVVPAHRAHGPVPFLAAGMEQVAFVEGRGDVEAAVKTARRLGPGARKAWALGAATLNDYSTEWIALTQADGGWVVRSWCGAEADHLTIDATARRLTFQVGEDTRSADIDAAVTTGADTMSLVRATESGAYLEVAEFHFVRPDRSEAEITCFTCPGILESRRFVDAEHASRYPSHDHPCNE